MVTGETGVAVGEGVEVGVLVLVGVALAKIRAMGAGRAQAHRKAINKHSEIKTMGRRKVTMMDSY
jgi:hypothetical protein